MKEKSPFASWPAEIRSAMLVDDHALLTFSEQYLLDIEHHMVELEKTYKHTIEEYYRLGGKCDVAKNEDGDDVPSELVFKLGSTEIQVSFSSNMMPISAIHRMDLLARPIVATSESEAICNMIRAIIYRDAPSKAILRTQLARKDIRNSAMVNGIDALVEEMKQFPNMVNNAISGARVERVNVDEE